MKTERKIGKNSFDDFFYLKKGVKLNKYLVGQPELGLGAELEQHQ